MDRNAEFRRRLDKRLNASSKKGHFVGKQSFDPTPYIDIVMERTYFEDAEDSEDIDILMEEILTDPDLHFIFGHSSLLNPAQKAKTGEGVYHRIVAYYEFDPQPHAIELIGLYQTPAFDQYVEIDEEGDEEFDFSPYFANYNFTKEQKELISDQFFTRRRGLLNEANEQKQYVQPLTKRKRE